MAIKSVLLILLAAIAGLLIWTLSSTTGYLGALSSAVPSPLPPIGNLVDPHEGLLSAASFHNSEADSSVVIAGLDGPVRVVRDSRGVPHIFAGSTRDAIYATGFVVAQDRLFQLDFIPRLVEGRLSEVFGLGTVSTDRFMRSIGIEWGVQRNLERVQGEDGHEWEMMNWYAQGVNAYRNRVTEAEMPIEFKLLNYEPREYRPEDTIRLLQYMAFDLSFSMEDRYASLQESMGDDVFRSLYPDVPSVYNPIVPGRSGRMNLSAANVPDPRAPRAESSVAGLVPDSPFPNFVEGLIEGKGSNNWAVAPERSATGSTILAGDMHLALSLPSIWYEIHLKTPDLNVYGVTIPGAILPVEGFNDHVAWAYTNTGSDQIDHYRMTLNEDRTRYLFGGMWRELEMSVDTIRVRDSGVVTDTLRRAHWGPVVDRNGLDVAIRWTAHEPGSTLKALWGMNHAKTLEEFSVATRDWDVPMQNILHADRNRIAIRSTGYLPVRRSGHGRGLLDGSSVAHEWTGRVAFDELPYSINPEQGFLTSTNQRPADVNYAHYLGYDWGSAYRSVRIGELLRSKEKHSVADIKSYHADVHVMQGRLFIPLLDTLSGLGEKAGQLRNMLGAWDLISDVNAEEPLIMDEFMRLLNATAWDEIDGPIPDEPELYRLLVRQPQSEWLDVKSTPEKEDAAALLATVMEATADSMEAKYGWNPSEWRWGDHHKVRVDHLLGQQSVAALGRGPFEFPGFAATLSPARSRVTTHSATWRMVVDFSGDDPIGYGVLPGGQSGNPANPNYDNSLQTYLNFDYHLLKRPNDPAQISNPESDLRLKPATTSQNGQ